MVSANPSSSFSDPFVVPIPPSCGASPADEVRRLLDQFPEAGAVKKIIAVAVQDNAVSLLAVSIILAPIRRELLDRDKQIIAADGAAPNHAARHRQIEWVVSKSSRDKYSKHCSASVRECWRRSPEAFWSTLCWNRSTAARTGARVFALTDGLPDIARDSVGCETQENLAMLNKVGRR